jgi:hypothetical protein
VLYSLRKVKERPKKGAVRDFFFYVVVVPHRLFSLFSFGAYFTRRAGKKREIPIR